MLQRNINIVLIKQASSFSIQPRYFGKNCRFWVVLSFRKEYRWLQTKDKLLLWSVAKQGVPRFTTQDRRVHVHQRSLFNHSSCREAQPKTCISMLSESEFCEAGNHILEILHYLQPFLLFRDTFAIILTRSNWLMSLERILLRRSCTPPPPPSLSSTHILI